jgi:hypothetical protein
MHNTDDKTPIAFDRNGKPICFGDEVVVVGSDRWTGPQKVGAVKLWPEYAWFYNKEGWALGSTVDVEVVEEPPFAERFKPGDRVQIVGGHHDDGFWRIIAWVPEASGKYAVVNRSGSLRSLHSYDQDHIRLVERAS